MNRWDITNQNLVKFHTELEKIEVNESVDRMQLWESEEEKKEVSKRKDERHALKESETKGRILRYLEIYLVRS